MVCVVVGYIPNSNSLMEDSTLYRRRDLRICESLRPTRAPKKQITN